MLSFSQDLLRGTSLSLSAAVALVFLTTGLLGCENKDLDALAQGQQCLDRASEPIEAENCRQFVEGKTGPQAMALACSIEFMAGGLTTKKILDAVKAQDDATDNKEANLMMVLALNDLDTAKDAVQFCNQSGVGGLIYLANLSLIGTTLASSIGFISVDGTPPTQAQIDDALDKCKSSDPSCEPEVIGEAALVLSESYCSGKDSEICKDIQEAVARGATAEDIGRELLELI